MTEALHSYANYSRAEDGRGKVESEAAAQGDRQTAENKCVNVSAEK